MSDVRVDFNGDLIIPRDLLSEWAGWELSDEQLDILATAIPHSSVPDAVGTMMAVHMPDDPGNFYED